MQTHIQPINFNALDEMETESELSEEETPKHGHFDQKINGLIADSSHK